MKKLNRTFILLLLSFAVSFLFIIASVDAQTNCYANRNVGFGIQKVLSLKMDLEESNVGETPFLSCEMTLMDPSCRLKTYYTKEGIFYIKKYSHVFELIV